MPTRALDLKCLRMAPKMRILGRIGVNIWFLSCIFTSPPQSSRCCEEVLSFWDRDILNLDPEHPEIAAGLKTHGAASANPACIATKRNVLLGIEKQVVRLVKWCFEASTIS